MPIKIDKTTQHALLTKTPGENLRFNIPLQNRMVAGDTISGFVATYPSASNLGYVQGSSNVTIVSSGYSGTDAQVQISGGTEGERYLVNVLVTTAGGETVEGFGVLLVTDNYGQVL